MGRNIGDITLATRPWSFPASLVGMLVGGALAWRAGVFFPSRFVLTLLGGFAVHAAANLTNTFFDYRSGLDRPESADDRTLVEGRMSPGGVLGLALGLYGVAVAVGLYLVAKAGWVLLGVGAVGALLAAGYTAGPARLKYRGLGDLAVFLCFGPLIVEGTYAVQTGRIGLPPLLCSLPIGLLVAAILHANNARDAEADARAGARTVAHLLGPERSLALYRFLIGSPYVLVLVLAVVVTPGTLITLLSLPLAVGLVRAYRAGDLARLPQRTAQVSLLFGLLLAAGTVIGPT